MYQKLEIIYYKFNVKIKLFIGLWIVTLILVGCARPDLSTSLDSNTLWITSSAGKAMSSVIETTLPYVSYWPIIMYDYYTWDGNEYPSNSWKDLWEYPNCGQVDSVPFRMYGIDELRSMWWTWWQIHSYFKTMLPAYLYCTMWTSASWFNELEETNMFQAMGFTLNEAKEMITLSRSYYPIPLTPLIVKNTLIKCINSLLTWTSSSWAVFIESSSIVGTTAVAYWTYWFSWENRWIGWWKMDASSWIFVLEKDWFTCKEFDNFPITSAWQLKSFMQLSQFDCDFSQRSSNKDIVKS